MKSVDHVFQRLMGITAQRGQCAHCYHQAYGGAVPNQSNKEFDICLECAIHSTRFASDAPKCHSLYYPNGDLDRESRRRLGELGSLATYSLYRGLGRHLYNDTDYPAIVLLHLLESIESYQRYCVNISESGSGSNNTISPRPHAYHCLCFVRNLNRVKWDKMFGRLMPPRSVQRPSRSLTIIWMLQLLGKQIVHCRRANDRTPGFAFEEHIVDDLCWIMRYFYIIIVHALHFLWKAKDETCGGTTEDLVAVYGWVKQYAEDVYCMMGFREMLYGMDSTKVDEISNMCLSLRKISFFCSSPKERSVYYKRIRIHQKLYRKRDPQYQCNNERCSKKKKYRRYSCSRCKSISYCSRGCQKYDWNKGGHKEICKQFLLTFKAIKSSKAFRL